MMAVKLVIPAYLGATVIFAFEFWRYSLVGGFLAITGKEGLIFFFAATVALLLALIWFLILAGIYTLLLKLLWSKPPRWLILPGLRALVIRDFGVLVLSTLPIIAIFAIYILFFTSLTQTFADLKTPRLTYDLFLLRFSWLWLVSAAYLYQWCTRKTFEHGKH
jgi:hypothetical protein